MPVMLDILNVFHKLANTYLDFHFSGLCIVFHVLDFDCITFADGTMSEGCRASAVVCPEGS